MKNQRMMTFSDKIEFVKDKSDSSIKYKFSINFSKKYIKGKKLLNVGSWTGPYEALAINYTSKITSTDIENKALNILKKTFPMIDCYLAPSHKLPFVDEAFEVVTLWDVLEHIPVGYELASLLEINRVLKKGGYLFLSTMNKNKVADLLDPAYWLVGHRHYSKDELLGLLSDSGFQTKRVFLHASLLSALDVIVFYIFKHIFNIKKPQINWLQSKIDKDYCSKGFCEIAVRAQKLK